MGFGVLKIILGCVLLHTFLFELLNSSMLFGVLRETHVLFGSQSLIVWGSQIFIWFGVLMVDPL